MTDKIFQVDFRYKDTTVYEFLSEDWNKAMTENIIQKFESGESFTELEEVFIHHQKAQLEVRRWKQELADQEYQGGTQLLNSNIELSSNRLLEC